MKSETDLFIIKAGFMLDVDDSLSMQPLNISHFQMPEKKIKPDPNLTEKKNNKKANMKKKKRRVKFFNIHRSKIIDRTLFKRKKVRPSRRKHETVQLESFDKSAS